MGIALLQRRCRRKARNEGDRTAPSETPAAYVRALGETVLRHPELEVIADVVTAAAYSGQEPSEQDQAEAERILVLACRSDAG